MGTFNIFEGCRRIALLLKVVYLVGVAVVSYGQSPYVSLEFFTSRPNEPFVQRPNAECDTTADSYEYVTREFAQGKTVSVQLCFKAVRSDNGRLLIPFTVEPSGRWWGNEKYSSDVRNYTSARSREFSLSAEDRDIASRLWAEQRSRNVRDAFLFAVGGWIALSVLQALIGWIVRGFLGIPAGQDRRPQAQETVAQA